MAYKNKEDQAKASKLWYERNKELTKKRTVQWKIDNAEKEKEQRKNRYSKINPLTGKKIGAEERQFYKKQNPINTKKVAGKYRDKKRLNHFNKLLQNYIQDYKNDFDQAIKLTIHIEFLDLISKDKFFNLQVLRSTTYVICKDEFFGEYLQDFYQLEEWLQNNFTKSERKSSIKILSQTGFKSYQDYYAGIIPDVDTSDLPNFNFNL
jgi:hypothetical protein